MTLTLALICTTAAHAAEPRIKPARESVVSQLDRGLAGTPMAGTGRELEAAGWKHRISPFFIAAIAGTESSFGAHSCSGNPKNAFGLSSCGSGWSVPYFKTWAQAYSFMAKFLTSRWSRARSSYEFYGYAACSSCWGRKVAEHMWSRWRISSSVRYG